MAKGSSFERDISVKLSLWFSEGKRDDIFYRSQSSGARATQRYKSKKTTEGQHGDIAATCSEGEPLIKKWNIELKSGYSKKGKLWSDKTTRRVTGYCLLDLLDSRQKDPIFLQFWAQTIKDSELSNREPILIFRRNLKDVCIAVNYSYYCKLSGWFGEISDVMTIEIRGNGVDIKIMRLSDFLNWVNSKILMELVK
jgi:hypothetical protein